MVEILSIILTDDNFIINENLLPLFKVVQGIKHKIDKSIKTELSLHCVI